MGTGTDRQSYEFSKKNFILLVHFSVVPTQRTNPDGPLWIEYLYDARYALTVGLTVQLKGRSYKTEISYQLLSQS